MNQLLIEQYVAGRMGEAEAEAFEVRCLEDPDLARQVELEQRLKSGFALVARGSTAEFVRSEKSLHRHVAVAASVLFACAALFLWQRQQVGNAPILAAVTSEAERNAASMRLALVRGNDGTPRVPDGRVRLEIVGLFDPGFQYSVVLDRIRNNELDNVATLFNEHPASPVTLEVMLDSDRLSPGTYSLRVRKQASAEEDLEFNFVKR
ncbi:MAG TPA: hypothetical protein VFS13_09060 [Steroidobacteraceae bacterium]|jgi:hypothetical protein|nr:hypothetical protein [Steroidobacteraceae bacterium]